MKRRTALIFYILSVYVFVQFIWWGYHLIELTQVVAQADEQISKRVIMILGEGAVFLILLGVGIWQIKRSIKKELKLSERQNNFLLSVTHELKTPLAANKLYLQTIGKREFSKEQQTELLNKAIDENVRLEHMIDNILNASRLENNALKAEFDEIDLSRLLAEIAMRFNNFKKGKDIEVECDNVQIKGDRFMIETMINNLVENAMKYGGDNPEITLYAFQKDGKTMFGVKDNGPGISKEYTIDIFKKFFRIGKEDNRTQRGSGLGLFIVSELVRMHKGTVSYVDNFPNGTNIQITLNNDF